MMSKLACFFTSLLAFSAALSSTPGSGKLFAVDEHGDVEAVAEADAEVDIGLLQGRARHEFVQDPGGAEQEDVETPSVEEAPADDQTPAEEGTVEAPAGDAAPTDDAATVDNAAPANDEAPANDAAAVEEEAPAAAADGDAEMPEGEVSPAEAEESTTPTSNATAAAADVAADAGADALRIIGDALDPAPTLTPTAEALRVNSAAPHSPIETTADRVMLATVMLLPLVIFLALKETDKREDQIDPAQADVRRMGGAYRPTPEGMRIEQGGFSPFSLYSMAFSDSYGEGSFVRNVLSGVATSLVCIPQAISFSFVLGVSPLNGIWAGAVLGLYASLVGGRPGMISCAAAATAEVLKEISRNPEFGIGPMAVAVGVCGLLQLVVGAMRLSRFVSLVPHTVMLGFMNGIAILISRGQLTVFQERSTGEWVESSMLRGMMYTCLVSMVSAVVFKRIPFVGNLCPAPIIAVAAASVYCYYTQDQFPMRSLEDVTGAGTFSGGWSSLPPLNFPAGEVRWDDGAMWSQCTIIGAQMALVGLVESLLTITVIDQITETRGAPQREVFAQGLGNLACAAFGLQGGCTVVGQSLLNVSSGGRSRVSGVTCAICLMLSVVVFGPLVGRMPVAALAGIMFLVGINTFCWGVFRLLHQMDFADILVIVLVTVVAVMVDLAAAVIAGLCFAAVAFAWRAAQDANIEEVSTAEGHEFRLYGPLFFASAMSYTRRIEAERINEKVVILDFSQGQVLDHSGLNAVAETCDRLADRGKQVFRHGLPREAEEALACMTQKGASRPSIDHKPAPVPYAPAAVMQPDGARARFASPPLISTVPRTR